MFPIAHKTEMPLLTVQQMVKVDELMEKEYGIRLLQMMENAGRCLAELTRTRFLDGDAKFKQVMVLVGSGNNGGGALVAARRLLGYGAKVSVVLAKPAKMMADLPMMQLRILEKMGVEVKEAKNLQVPAMSFDAVIDGIIGYSLKGNPQAGASKLIEWANAQTAPVLSLDTPSGLDLTTGEIYEPAVKATATLTLALPKASLLEPQASAHVGELYLGDIGVPPQLYAMSPLKLTVGAVFAKSDILRVQS